MDRQTDWAIHRASWSQLKSLPFAAPFVEWCLRWYFGLQGKSWGHLPCLLKKRSEVEGCKDLSRITPINTLRPRQNGRHFADDTFKRIFMNENVRISINISLKFVPKGLINNIPTLVQIMAWRRPGDKPLSEPMMISLPTHICGTRPQWVN